MDKEIYDNKATKTFWPREDDKNYSPFILFHDHESGQSFGLLIICSGPLDVIKNGNRLTYRLIQGEFDFYFITGNSILNTIANFHNLIGTTQIPPLWTLGWHYGKENPS